MIQGAKVSVGGTQIPTNFNNATGEWEATIPAPVSAAYAITILQEDLAKVLTLTLDVLDLPGGQALRLTALNASNLVETGVRMKVHHQGIGLADNGLLDDVLTASITGKVIVFLDAGNHNVVITAPGFQPVRLKTVQVSNGTPNVDAGGTQLASHTLKNNQAAVVAGARIFIQKTTEAILEDSLAAARTVDGAGLWTANLDPATPYRFCMHAPGFDSVIAEVDSIG